MTYHTTPFVLSRDISDNAEKNLPGIMEIDHSDITERVAKNDLVKANKQEIYESDITDVKDDVDSAIKETNNLNESEHNDVIVNDDK